MLSDLTSGDSAAGLADGSNSGPLDSRRRKYNSPAKTIASSINAATANFADGPLDAGTTSGIRLFQTSFCASVASTIGAPALGIASRGSFASAGSAVAVTAAAAGTSARSDETAAGAS